MKNFSHNFDSFTFKQFKITYKQIGRPMTKDNDNKPFCKCRKKWLECTLAVTNNEEITLIVLIKNSACQPEYKLTLII